MSGWGAPDVKNLMLDLDGTTTPVHLTTPNPPPAITATISGTTCPGPQMIDGTGDAPNDYTGGDGSNMDDSISSTRRSRLRTRRRCE